MSAALTPGEARVAALCVSSALAEYDKLDPGCPLHVYTETRGPLGSHSGIPEPVTTGLLVDGARTALAKLRALAGGAS